MIQLSLLPLLPCNPCFLACALALYLGGLSNEEGGHGDKAHFEVSSFMEDYGLPDYENEQRTQRPPVTEATPYSFPTKASLHRMALKHNLAGTFKAFAIGAIIFLVMSCGLRIIYDTNGRGFRRLAVGGHGGDPPTNSDPSNRSCWSGYYLDGHQETELSILMLEHNLREVLGSPPLVHEDIEKRLELAANCYITLLELMTTERQTIPAFSAAESMIKMVDAHATALSWLQLHCDSLNLQSRLHLQFLKNLQQVCVSAAQVVFSQHRMGGFGPASALCSFGDELHLLQLRLKRYMDNQRRQQGLLGNMLHMLLNVHNVPVVERKLGMSAAHFVRSAAVSEMLECLRRIHCIAALPNLNEQAIQVMSTGLRALLYEVEVLVSVCPFRSKFFARAMYDAVSRIRQHLRDNTSRQTALNRNPVIAGSIRDINVSLANILHLVDDPEPLFNLQTSQYAAGRSFIMNVANISYSLWRAAEMLHQGYMDVSAVCRNLDELASAGVERLRATRLNISHQMALTPSAAVKQHDISFQGDAPSASVWIPFGSRLNALTPTEGSYGEPSSVPSGVADDHIPQIEGRVLRGARRIEQKLEAYSRSLAISTGYLRSRMREQFRMSLYQPALASAILQVLYHHETELHSQLPASFAPSLFAGGGDTQRTTQALTTITGEEQRIEADRRLWDHRNSVFELPRGNTFHENLDQWQMRFEDLLLERDTRAGLDSEDLESSLSSAGGEESIEERTPTASTDQEIDVTALSSIRMQGSEGQTIAILALTLTCIHLVVAGQ